MYASTYFSDIIIGHFHGLDRQNMFQFVTLHLARVCGITSSHGVHWTGHVTQMVSMIGLDLSDKESAEYQQGCDVSLPVSGYR